MQKIEQTYDCVSYLECMHVRNWFKFVLQSKKISLDNQMNFVEYIFRNFGDFSIELDIFYNVASIDLEKYMICKYGQHILQYPIETCIHYDEVILRFYQMRDHSNANNTMNTILSMISPTLFGAIVYGDPILSPIIRPHIPTILDDILRDEPEEECAASITNQKVEMMWTYATNDIFEYFSPLFLAYGPSRVERITRYILRYMEHPYVTIYFDNQNWKIMDAIFQFSFCHNRTDLFVQFLKMYPTFISQEFIMERINIRIRKLIQKTIGIMNRGDNDIDDSNSYTYVNVISHIDEIMNYIESQNLLDRVEPQTKRAIANFRAM